MTYEDFTTYTEVDPGTYLDVDSSTQLHANPFDRDISAYLYKDFGAGHFTDFEFLISLEHSSGVHSARMCSCGVSNDLTDTNNWTNGINLLTSINTLPTPDVLQTQIRDEYDNDHDDVDLDLTTQYWFTINRTGGTVTCYIYEDSDRTELFDTITIDVDSGTSYRYMFPISSFNSSSSNYDFYGYVYDLDLQEGVTPEYHYPTDTAKASDLANFSAGEILEDNAKASDLVTHQAEVTLDDNAKASDSVNYVLGETHNIGDTAKASDLATFQAEETLDDNAKASDLATFQAEETLEDTAKASDSVNYSLVTPLTTPTENIVIWR